MKRLAVVVEGATDKTFFQALRGWFETAGFTVSITTAHDRPRLIRNAAKHLAAHTQAGRDIVAFVLDQHDDKCPPMSAERLSEVSGHGSVLIVVVARCLEAWLLADEAAVSEATGRNYRCGGATDGLSDPYRLIRQLFYRSRRQYLSKAEIVRAIAPRFDLERASRNSRSLSRFRDKLVALSGA